MYIAMNRFKVAPGSEQAFEKVWTGRDSHLSAAVLTLPGVSVASC